MNDLSDKNLLKLLRGKKYNIDLALKTSIELAKFHVEHASLFEQIKEGNITDFLPFAKFVTVLPIRLIHSLLFFMIRLIQIMTTHSFLL